MPKSLSIVLGMAMLLALMGVSWGQRQPTQPQQLQQPPQPFYSRPRPSPQPPPPPQPPPQAQAVQQPIPADTRGTEESPLIVRSIHSREEVDADAAQRSWEASSDRWNKIFSAAAVGATVLQALIFIVIIRTSRNQSKAYVFVEVQEDDRPYVDFNIGARITLRGRNRGQTPAYRVSQITRCEILPFPLSEAPPPAQTTEPISFITLGPTADFPIFGRIARALTESEKSGLMTGQMRVYIYGEIKYSDAFALWRDSRQSRLTQFCYMVPFDQHGRPNDVMVCLVGNRAN
jgi:hypothetical protein